MTRQTLVLGAVLVLLVAGGAAFFVRQARSLRELRAEAQALRMELSRREASEFQVSSTTAGEGGALKPEERMELMELRNRVSEMRERQRMIAVLSNQVAALRAQVAGLQNYAGGEVPPGYVRRLDAQNRGLASPEAALETFLWSITQRDPDSLSAVLTPERVEDLRRRMAEDAEAVFTDLLTIPGFRIVGRVERGPDEVELRVETAPGVEQGGILARRVDGEWKLDVP